MTQPNKKRKVKKLTEEMKCHLHVIKLAQKENLKGLFVNMPHDWYWVLLRYSRAYLENKDE